MESQTQIIKTYNQDAVTIKIHDSLGVVVFYSFLSFFAMFPLYLTWEKGGFLFQH